ncbi:MAG TPA: hypothetical protein VFR55_00270 [Dehalococcoidia bacterium]|nr:hypothetical protein [Dehalococcoidia bacterium]
MQEKPGFSRWFRKLRDDIKELAQGAGDPVRLVRLQNALVDLIGHLDPGGLKCLLDRRTRVAPGEVTVP